MDNWFLHPSKKAVIWFILTFLAGVLLLFYASDHFKKLNIILVMALLGAFLSVIRLLANY